MDVITSHINTDFDGLAAMLAARRLYPGAEMVLPGSSERSLQDFFINSCGYVFPFKTFKEIDPGMVTRLIIVDTRQRSRIGGFAAIAARPGVEVIVFDHHPPSDEDLAKPARLEVAEVGAVVTLLAEKLRDAGLQPPPEEATMMLIGLYEDTGSLTFATTTGRDFAAAAWLLEQGGDLETVAGVVNNPLNREQVALLHDLLTSERLYYPRGRKVALVEASREHYIPDVALVVHRLRDIERHPIIIALVRLEDKIYLIGRSHSPALDVGRLLARFGGGGHAGAASAVCRDLTLVQCREKLLARLEEEIEPLFTAADLMTTSLLTINPEQSLREAGALLTRYNINVLPVVAGAGEKSRNGPETAAGLVGLISRQVVEKALYHGLGELPVSEYMSTDHEPIPPDADLERIKRLIVERNQRFLPVVDARGCLLGAITRKDLLEALYESVDEVSGGRPVEEPRYGRVRRKNVKGLLRESFPRELLAVFSRLGELGDELGCRLFLVGGVVRDMLLRRPNLDVDIVVEGDGIALARLYVERYGGCCHAHQPFRTAVLSTGEGYKIDIASTRMEYYDAPASLPKVEKSSLKADLYRRDFTINTLVVALNPKNFGELRDYFGAGRDLKEGTIRVLHNLSFVEDPTRIFRAVRFEQKFNFTIGRQTLRLIHNAVRVGILRRLSGSRILHELKLICAESDPLPIFARLNELNLWPEIFSDLERRRFRPARLAVRLKAVREVVTWYEYLYLERRLKSWQVYLLAFLDGLRRDEAAYCVTRLGFDPRAGERFIAARQRGIEVAAELGRGFAGGRSLPHSVLHARLEELPLEVLLYIMARQGNEAVRKALSHYITYLQFVRLEIGGRDLIALGLEPGPRFKTILDQVLAARLDGEVGDRKGELALAARLARAGDA